MWKEYVDSGQVHFRSFDIIFLLVVGVVQSRASPAWVKTTSSPTEADSDKDGMVTSNEVHGGYDLVDVAMLQFSNYW